LHASFGGNIDRCIVHGVCWATIEGFVNVKGRRRGTDRVLEGGWRRTDIKSTLCLVGEPLYIAVFFILTGEWLDSFTSRFFRGGLLEIVVSTFELPAFSQP
jgi:hypothetical protein